MRISDWSSDVCSSDLLDSLVRCRWIDRAQALVGEIAQSRHEAVPEQVKKGEYVIGGPAGVGVVLARAQAAPVKQQSVQHVGGFAGGRRDDPGVVCREVIGQAGVDLDPWLGIRSKE